MGCWNATCGLTNLPILAGEEVYVFPLKEVDLSGYRSHCETTALYSPSLVSFIAKYNDYGAGEDCRGDMLSPIIEAIKDELVELEVGENQYHDIAVKREGFDAEMFFEAVHENRLLVKGWGKNHPVFFAMIRKDIADRLWKEWKFDIYVGEGAATDPTDAYERAVTYERLAEEFLPKFLDCAKQKLEESSEKDRHRILNRMMLSSREFPTLRTLFINIDSHHYWDLLYFKETVSDKILAGDYEAASELMKIRLLGVMVDEMMSSVRKIWLPVMHQGSQSSDYPEYRLLHQLSNDVISEREEYFRAWEEEDEDDDLPSEQ